MGASRWTVWTAAAAALLVGPTGPAAGIGPTHHDEPGSKGGRVTDSLGDTVETGDRAPLYAPRGDVADGAAILAVGAWRLEVRTRQTVDPRADPAWASRHTRARWVLDSDGDGIGDYVVEYRADGGVPHGDVYLAGAEAPIPCPVRAEYLDGIHTVVVPTTCLDAPAAVSYAVSLAYDTDPPHPGRQVSADRAPDGGLAGSGTVAAGET